MQALWPETVHFWQTFYFSIRAANSKLGIRTQKNVTNIVIVACRQWHWISDWHDCIRCWKVSCCYALNACIGLHSIAGLNIAVIGRDSRTSVSQTPVLRPHQSPNLGRSGTSIPTQRYAKTIRAFHQSYAKSLFTCDRYSIWLFNSWNIYECYWKW